MQFIYLYIFSILMLIPTHFCMTIISKLSIGRYYKITYTNPEKWTDLLFTALTVVVTIGIDLILFF